MIANMTVQIYYFEDMILVSRFYAALHRSFHGLFIFGFRSIWSTILAFPSSMRIDIWDLMIAQAGIETSSMRRMILKC